MKNTRAHLKRSKYLNIARDNRGNTLEKPKHPNIRTSGNSEYPSRSDTGESGA